MNENIPHNFHKIYKNCKDLFIMLACILVAFPVTNKIMLFSPKRIQNIIHKGMTIIIPSLECSYLLVL